MPRVELQRQPPVHSLQEEVDISPRQEVPIVHDITILEDYIVSRLVVLCAHDGGEHGQHVLVLSGEDGGRDCQDVGVLLGLGGHEGEFVSELLY